MLQHLGTGDAPVLIYMAHDEKGNLISLTGVDEQLGALPHLGDAPRGGGDGGKADGLDGIHHHHIRLFRQDGFVNLLCVGGGGEEDVISVHPQAVGPQLHLAHALLPGYIEEPQAGVDGAAHLEEDGGFADAGVAADQDGRAGDDAAAQHPVQLLHAGVIPHRFVGGNIR